MILCWDHVFSLAWAVGGIIFCATGDRKEVRMSSSNGFICRRFAGSVYQQNKLYHKEFEVFSGPRPWNW